MQKSPIVLRYYYYYVPSDRGRVRRQQDCLNRPDTLADSGRVTNSVFIPDTARMVAVWPRLGRSQGLSAAFAPKQKTAFLHSPRRTDKVIHILHQSGRDGDVPLYEAAELQSFQLAKGSCDGPAKSLLKSG